MERLKQKVASSSSRVIASIAQATGSLSAAQANCQSQQPQVAVPHQELESGASSAEPPPTSWLIAAGATAHLTEEERKILLEVFKKEEQFRRDTIKQMSASRAMQSAPSQSGEQLPRHPSLRQSRAPRQRLNSSSSNQENYQASGADARHSSRNRAQSYNLRQSRSVGQQQQSFSASNSFASASSATPSSRPGSSAFGTPVGAAGQRAASSCSAVLPPGEQEGGAAGSVGQCRICRKLIAASEPVHLCSNCNQFVCEDCASYSATDQHWMCSSCRRRAMNPAIPTEALRELGLNQNSSAVRRMTLRLNQSELKVAAGKGSNESTASSNSSSGCSSMSNSAHVPPAASASATPPNPRRPSCARASPAQVRDQASEPARAATPSSQRSQCRAFPQQADAEPRAASGQRASAHIAGSNAPPPQQQPNCDTLGNSPSQMVAPSESFAAGSPERNRRASAQVEVGVARQTQVQAHGLVSPHKSMSQPVGQPPHQRQVQASARPTGAMQTQWTPPSAQQVAQQSAAFRASQQARRASVAVSPSTGAQARPNWRKQSIAFIHQNSLAYQQQYLANQVQFVQPQTMVTATSDLSVDDGGSRFELRNVGRLSGRRESNAIYQNDQTPPANATLIPVPPDQIHLRRLSDQSNLVRRSSIIADTIDSITMSRFRSHSNIDAVTCASYFAGQQQQQPHLASSYAGYSEENLRGYGGQLQSLGVDGYLNQRRLSDQGEIRHQQPQYLAQQAQSQSQQLSSLITSYSQKRRGSTRDPRSDSSSDIDEPDARAGQSARVYDAERPVEYFAPQPPRLAHASFGYDNQISVGQQKYVNNCPSASAQMPIPSVSVSEFSQTNHQRASLHQQQQQQQQQHQQHQQPHAIYDPVITSPMQINVAIEQAIRAQQQHELVPATDYLAPRRGSSGRVLPKTPGEQQSRSLLDLPLQNAATQGNPSGEGQNQSTLDLPCLSPTIRRASAPEGQNIKIVVDDIDGSMRGAAGHHGKSIYGDQGELYERLVLYRDDSLDPNTNTGRGFGLHVMGGKMDREGRLQAYVTWVLPGGPADKLGLRSGDKIVEWDAKSLLDLTYEQVAEIIEDSANIAELLVRPVHKLELSSGANYIRSQRRLSQQTERDLRRYQRDASLVQHHQNGSEQHHRNEWRQSSELVGEQLRLHHSGTQQQQLGNGASSGVGRAGTGRRLPQIPGIMTTSSSGVESNGVVGLAPMSNKVVSSSAGQLEHVQVSNGPGGQPTSQNLSANPQQEAQQRTRSATDLYQNMNLAQNLDPTRNGLSSETLNSKHIIQQHWPQHQQVPGVVVGYQHVGTGGLTSGANLDTVSASQARDEVCGLIGLQVSVDERVGQLEISVLSAINIERDFSLDYCVRVRILPESARFKACTTQPSSDLNWEETFIFQNFPTNQVSRMALEIGVWVYDDAPRLSTQLAQPICEALIPIQSARERNTDFWPLRPPPTSPQARRKSLNDLLESCSDARKKSEAIYSLTQQASAPRQPRSVIQQQVPYQQQPGYWTPPSADQPQYYGSSSLHQTLSSQNGSRRSSTVFVRERSASNRNLPDTSKLQAQPRRASDEVATSSSHRLMSKLSPAASRRSISAMNVGDGHASVLLKSSPRLSQANIIKAAIMRRDSYQTHQSPTHGSPLSGGYSPRQSSQNQDIGSPNSMPPTRAGSDSQPPAGTAICMTPSGRRSSLAGVQSMAGYRSQKNSQSNATENESPTDSKRSQSGTPQKVADLRRAQHEQQGTGSSSNSRRNSSERGVPQLQRKGSFAMTTLRKFKRTMSLTKGSDAEPGASSSSAESIPDQQVDVDLGATRIVSSHTAVGKVKLSFIMTKGQFEVEVICAAGLSFDSERALGIYVKIYLKGKNKGNKRKTRVLQPTDTPVFRQTIKYDGSLIDNKNLEVSVWLKQGGRKGKVPIGFTEISIGDLNLASLHTSWYNLRSMDTQFNSSSVED